jgi:RNA recognition motif-containing protein
VYVGNLSNNVSKFELEDVFNRYGKLRNVWVARNPPGFAFIEFEDERDAEDAVKALDGTRICGSRAVVRTCTLCRTRGQFFTSPQRAKFDPQG